VCVCVCVCAFVCVRVRISDISVSFFLVEDLNKVPVQPWADRKACLSFVFRGK
jgi:hypothetical protein